LGQQNGTETVTLTVNQIAAHNHNATVTVKGSQRGDTDNPSGAAPGGGSGQQVYASSGPDGSTVMNAGMAAAAVSNAGGSQPHPNIQPYLCVNFIIALQGIFPSRN
jgi:microcystin-dependent protein